jgi:hypothetical protein
MERRARGDGRAWPVARSAPASKTRERKGREEGEGGVDRWGRRVGDYGEKEKGERGGGPLREIERWAGWAKREVRSFFLLPFSNFFKSNLFNSNSQNFSNFFTKFYKPFRPHTSNQKPCITK